MLRVRLTQLDGSLPNLAIARISSFHKAQGHSVFFTRQAHRDLLEPDYDVTYGSAIFAFSAPKIHRFIKDWPDAILGGTYDPANTLTVEDIIGSHEGIDYDLYPEFQPSIGYTQRGCRFNCAWCVVPGKEGKARSTATIADIWRGPGHPRKIALLDNDFFGQSKRDWLARIDEIRNGGFKVCWSQGINIRVVTTEIARAIASVEYRDTKFREKRLYTAWDSAGDQRLFFRGVDLLAAAGVPPQHIRAYMLTGFAPGESLSEVQNRFQAMVQHGIEPYPMVFDCRDTDPDRYRILKRFQRYAVMGQYRAFPFEQYDTSRGPRNRALDRPTLARQTQLALP